MFGNLTRCVYNVDMNHTSSSHNLLHNWKVIAFFKIAILTLILVVGVLSFIFIRKNSTVKSVTNNSGFAGLMSAGEDSKILTIPYQQTLYKHFGSAINPQVKIPVKTVNGYKKMEFLIDSGAVVSALPKILAGDLGADLSNMPRITIEGFAGQKTFAYRGEFVIMIGEDEVVIPVVFSENAQASNILGRIGFFDQFNINFNAETKNIEISKKG